MFRTLDQLLVYYIVQLQTIKTIITQVKHLRECALSRMAICVTCRVRRTQIIRTIIIIIFNRHLRLTDRCIKLSSIASHCENTHFSNFKRKTTQQSTTFTTRNFRMKNNNNNKDLRVLGELIFLLHFTNHDSFDPVADRCTDIETH